MLKKIVLMGLLCFWHNAFALLNDEVQNGFFYAYNDTDKEVVISVGNFFPTPYTIGPHKSTFVHVSTDNQNIHIVSLK